MELLSGSRLLSVALCSLDLAKVPHLLRRSGFFSIERTDLDLDSLRTYVNRVRVCVCASLRVNDYACTTLGVRGNGKKNNYSSGHKRAPHV